MPISFVIQLLLLIRLYHTCTLYLYLVHNYSQWSNDHSYLFILDVAERVEARHHLKTILSLKEFHSLSTTANLTLLVCYTLALLETVTYQFEQVG